MEITVQTIINFAAVLSAIIAIGGLIFSCLKWFLKQEKQSKDIAKMKDENCLICYALSACLDGLGQLGANHSVPTAKEKLDKYLNEQAHK